MVALGKPKKVLGPFVTALHPTTIECITINNAKDEITAAASLSLIKGKVNIAAIIAVKIPPIKIDNIGSKATFSKIG